MTSVLQFILAVSSVAFFVAGWWIGFIKDDWAKGAFYLAFSISLRLGPPPLSEKRP